MGGRLRFLLFVVFHRLFDLGDDFVREDFFAPEHLQFDLYVFVDSRYSVVQELLLFGL